jgi:hypothetical protein
MWKKLVFAVLIVAVSTVTAGAEASYKCGIEPAPPSSCRATPVCWCDGDNNCRWMFRCSDEDN